MGMLQSYIRFFTPLSPRTGTPLPQYTVVSLPLYPLSCPNPIARLPRYPFYPDTTEDSLCESS